MFSRKILEIFREAIFNKTSSWQPMLVKKLISGENSLSVAPENIRDGFREGTLAWSGPNPSFTAPILQKHLCLFV